MASTASAPDLATVLAALAPEVRQAIEHVHAQVSRISDGEPFDWFDDPSTRRFAELAAFVAMAERIRLEEGCGLKEARIAAAIRLGLNEETLERRLRRARGTNCPPASREKPASVVS